MCRVRAPFPVVDQSGQCGHTYLVFSDRFRGGATGSGTGAVAERAGFLKSMHYYGFHYLIIPWTASSRAQSCP